MTKINEEKLISVLYANFQDKSKKMNDWIHIAKITKQLSEFYGSYKKLATKLGLANETLREVLKLLKLPKRVQEMVKRNELKHEVAWRIASVKGEINQIKVAKAVKGLSTHDARDIVRVFRTNPSIDLKTYIARFNDSKKKVEKINLMILPIDEINLLHIKKYASIQKMSAEKFISKVIIPEWIKKGIK